MSGQAPIGDPPDRYPFDLRSAGERGYHRDDWSDPIWYVPPPVLRFSTGVRAAWDPNTTSTRGGQGITWWVDERSVWSFTATLVDRGWTEADAMRATMGEDLPWYGVDTWSRRDEPAPRGRGLAGLSLGLTGWRP